MSTKNNRPSMINKAISQTQNSVSKKAAGNRGLSGCCGFRLPKRSQLSPLNFLNSLESKVAKALRSWRRHSSAGRPRPLVAPIDTHRTEAISDCIEFINSSSLPRSNSVTGNPS
uniref:Josephin-like protein n=1 Tax=Manihot esculenta TaxID=3983 RepID=A0A2C9WLT6_MANES